MVSRQTQLVVAGAQNRIFIWFFKMRDRELETPYLSDNEIGHLKVSLIAMLSGA